MAAAPTVLRVKRLRSQDPSEVIVVSAKRRREEGGQDFTILKVPQPFLWFLA